MRGHLSRELPYTHKDEGRFVMKITYKPNRHIVDGRKVSEYYYTLRLIPADNGIYVKYEEYAEKHKRQTGREYDIGAPPLLISFLDSKGNTLFRHISGGQKSISDGWLFTGRFSEKWLPIESFFEVHSIVVVPNE